MKRNWVQLATNEPVAAQDLMAKSILMTVEHLYIYDGSESFLSGWMVIWFICSSCRIHRNIDWLSMWSIFEVTIPIVDTHLNNVSSFCFSEMSWTYTLNNHLTIIWQSFKAFNLSLLKTVEFLLTCLWIKKQGIHGYSVGFALFTSYDCFFSHWTKPDSVGGWSYFSEGWSASLGSLAAQSLQHFCLVYV